MKSFLKVSLLVGLMVLLLLAAPAIAGHIFGSFAGGLLVLAALALGGVLLLGLVIVGGGTALVVGLALLVALACVVLAALLPIALPVLVIVGLVALITKLARRSAPPPVAA